MLSPHNIYVEPFLGTGAVTLKKAPVLHSVGLDLNGSVIENFKEVISANAYPGNIELTSVNAIEWLASYQAPDGTVIYYEPPYLHSTRTSRQRYRFEMMEQDHVAYIKYSENTKCICLDIWI